MSEAANRTVEIVNKRGLHARASAKFVKMAAGFDAEVRVSKDGQTVDARSIMGLMML
ncbi:HPr family phosphocarrier protein, partial [Phenylobacterium sp.]|uniref:HPr family phosphocarrier protein n=1 Tax=Phenylobacterium sp. TaxID=1871053 RepID=UPI002812350C